MNRYVARLLPVVCLMICSGFVWIQQENSLSEVNPFTEEYLTESFHGYYTATGRKIGALSDLDTGIYLVTNRQDIKTIKENTKLGLSTSLDEVQSALMLPATQVRRCIIAAVNRSNAPSALDPSGGKHEEGIVWGMMEGKLHIIEAKPGGAPAAGMSIGTEVPLDVFKANNLVDQRVMNFLGTEGFLGVAHVHPGGEHEGLIFEQPPSSGKGQDIDVYKNWKEKGMMKGDYAIVVGANRNRVYFYNEEGVLGTFNYDKFKALS